MFLINGRFWFRADLTSNRAYTLSQITKNLKIELNDILRITYFVSDRLVSAHPLPDEISALIKEIVSFSGGKIRFYRKDPVKNGLVREMEFLGIQPQTVRIIENGEITIAEVYTGIAIEYLDKIEVLPLVFSIETLEYDIAGRVISLGRNRARELGVIIGDSSKQWHTDYALLDAALRQWGYRILMIQAGEEIPETLPALFVLGGADELDEWALYRIDFYIQRGGNVLFAQDSLRVNLHEGMEVEPVYDLGMFAMLASYGAVILPAFALDTASLRIGYSEREGTAAAGTINYPLWIDIQEQNANRNHHVNSDFTGMYLYWASPLELFPPSGVAAEPLFYSSSGAWLMSRNYSVDPLDFYPANNPGIEQEAVLTRGRKILGAALYGVFPGFFKETEKPVREGSMTILPDMPSDALPSRIIVIGDTDFAGAMMEAGGGEQGNLNFIRKAADWLSNDLQPIGLRRGLTGRLDRIQDLDARYAAMNFARNFNVFALPVIILAAGFFIIRKKNRAVLFSRRGAGGKRRRGEEVKDTGRSNSGF